MSLFGAGCTGSLGDGVPAPMAELLEPCEGNSGARRDFCAYEALEAAAEAGAAGTDIAIVCARIEDRTSLDQCIELSMRSAPIPAAELCDEIVSDRLRYSCWLGAADAVTRAEPDLSVVLSGCARTGPLLQHCLAHVAEYRSANFRPRGLADLETDVIAIQRRFEGTSDMPHFGSAVGFASAELGANGSSLAPCSLLSGQTAELCWTRLRHNARSRAGRPSNQGHPPRRAADGAPR